MTRDTLVSKLTLKRISLVLALVIAAFSLVSIYIISSKNRAKASATLSVHGDGIQIMKPGSSEWAAVVDSVDIASDTRVRSDEQSSAEIDYREGTSTQIDANSEIIVEDQESSPQKIGVGLVKGRVWNTIAKTKGGITYQTKTLNMSVTVYGTAYSHEILPDGRERVVVTENAVLVECLGNPDLASKQVEEGNMLTSDCASALASTEAPPDILTAATPPADFKNENNQTSKPSSSNQPSVQGAQTQGQATPQPSPSGNSVGGSNSNKGNQKDKDSPTPTLSPPQSNQSPNPTHAPPVQPESGGGSENPAPCPTNPQGNPVGNCKNG